MNIKVQVVSFPHLMLSINNYYYLLILLNIYCVQKSCEYYRYIN